MVSNLNIEKEIYNCVDTNESFVLDAGAGSGKTWTLIQTLKYLIEFKSNDLKKANQKIVCITFTNVAKNEILERIERNSLVTVSTIHDFLWDCISQYKYELKEKLIEYLNEKIAVVNQKISELKIHGTKKESELLEKQTKLNNAISSIKANNKPVTYKEYLLYKESIISHDDLIIIAYKIFSSYEMINKIIRDAFPIILVDEYQDTQEPVIKLLCEYVHTKDNFLLGFFGDKMQKIYEHGIGEIPLDYDFKRLKKHENYRCPLAVIELLNRIRKDITQIAAGKNKERNGSISFYLSNSISETELIEKYLNLNWNANIEDVKILYLTHRLIAKKNGYYKLFELYNSKRRKDYLTDNKNNRGCPFANLLYSIGELIELFNTKRTQELLDKINLSINSFSDRDNIRELIIQLIENSETKTIEEIFNFIVDNNILVLPDKFKEFDLDDPLKKEFHEQLMKIEYKQFADLYQVQQDETPFSTKHGTKGDEFNNVLAVIDDTAWRNSYNFNNYFANTETSENRFAKTENLFYVVCSRAKVNLSFLCISPLTDNGKDGIKKLFGKDNYKEV